MSYFILDAHEEFKDKLHVLVEHGENYIAGLSDKRSFKNYIDELFRMFHSLKPTCYYLEYKEVYRVVVAIEDLLSALRLQTKPPRKDVIDWLFLIFDYLAQCEAVAKEEREDFPALDSFTLNMFRTAIISSAKKEKPLDGRTILLVHPDEVYSKKLMKALSAQCESIVCVKTINDAHASINTQAPDFLITILKPGTGELVRTFKIDSGGPAIVIVNEEDKSLMQNMKDVMVDEYIPQPKEIVDFVNMIRQYATLYFQEKLIKLTDKKVMGKLRELKSLPDTLLEVQKSANDEKSGLREVAQIVSKDPIMSAKMLEAINSPLYGLRQRVDSVSQAVTMLGKERTVSLCIQASMGAQLSADLTPYDLSVRQFYNIAQLRNEIMIGWFSKVSFADLPILSTATLIGNIGQIIIAKVLKERQSEVKFASAIASSGRLSAEIEYVGATSEDITADMLAVWGMSPTLIDSIRYAFDLAHCPDSLKKLAIANFIVYSLVPSTDDCIDFSKREELVEFATEMNLKGDMLDASIERVVNNKVVLA